MIKDIVGEKGLCSSDSCDTLSLTNISSVNNSCGAKTDQKSPDQNHV